MRIFIALLLLLASWRSARAAPQYEDGDSDDYDDWGFGSRGEVSSGYSDNMTRDPKSIFTAARHHRHLEVGWRRWQQF